ncbi:2-aminoethylphosphonate-binding periplasmic protein [Streptomyces lydicamycinicus]|uniref:2-aminoethylphosphonate-binding periplasmic protein n=1 Tax=Streptomyces lydicamycinicus TaxID=1546107 RepID=A0A0P4R8C1_9ACTN|nr:2-aminoethylphosphonate-binding periplasmic protein [Streptomyces lydicamycinicus]
MLVTLPPFIQQAEGKGLLDTYRPKGADQVAAADKAPSGKWTSIVNNYFCFIYNKKELKRAPATWQDLLDASSARSPHWAAASPPAKTSRPPTPTPPHSPRS